jgi:hypothetical protein
MSKSEAIARLDGLRISACEKRIRFPLVRFLATQLRDPSIPEYENETLDRWLPRQIVCIMEWLRTADKRDQRIGEVYRDLVVGMQVKKVPSLTCLGDQGPDQNDLRISLSFKLAELLFFADAEKNDWMYLGERLYDFFTAEETVLVQAIDRFYSAVYQDGFDEVVVSGKKPNRHLFGPTKVEVTLVSPRSASLCFTRRRTDITLPSFTALFDVSLVHKTAEAISLREIDGDLSSTLTMLTDAGVFWPAVKSKLSW